VWVIFRTTTRPTSISRHVGCPPKSGGEISGICHNGPWRVDDAARHVIQAQLEQRGVPREKDFGPSTTNYNRFVRRNRQAAKTCGFRGKSPRRVACAIYLAGAVPGGAASAGGGAAGRGIFGSRLALAVVQIVMLAQLDACRVGHDLAAVHFGGLVTVNSDLPTRVRRGVNRHPEISYADPLFHNPLKLGRSLFSASPRCGSG
jgi:hypothetical protein